MDLAGSPLHLGPRSSLNQYRCGRGPLRAGARLGCRAGTGLLLDLYCGVGGFGLFTATLLDARPCWGRVSADAVASARHTAENATTELQPTASSSVAATPDPSCRTRMCRRQPSPPRPGRRAVRRHRVEQRRDPSARAQPDHLARDLAALPTFAVIDARCSTCSRRHRTPRWSSGRRVLRPAPELVGQKRPASPAPMRTTSTAVAEVHDGGRLGAALPRSMTRSTGGRARPDQPTLAHRLALAGQDEGRGEQRSNRARRALTHDRVLGDARRPSSSSGA